MNSFFWGRRNRAFSGSIQGLTGPNQQHDLDHKSRISRIERQIGVYSAAATNFGFWFADDTMKSEMRGTISDLKREPLKTP
jgi:hypothetical protein